MLHTKFQPSVPSHSGKKIDLIGSAIFSIDNHLGFSTRLNFIILSKSLQTSHAARLI